MQPLIIVLVTVIASGSITRWLLSRRHIDFELIWSQSPSARPIVKIALFVALAAVLMIEKLSPVTLEFGQLPISIWYIVALQVFFWFRCILLLQATHSDSIHSEQKP